MRWGGYDGGLCNHRHLTPLTRMSLSYVSTRLGPRMRDDDVLSVSACIAVVPHASGMNVLRSAHLSWGGVPN